MLDALLWEAGEYVKGGGPGPVPGMVTYLFMHSRGLKDNIQLSEGKEVGRGDETLLGLAFHEELRVSPRFWSQWVC